MTTDWIYSIETMDLDEFVRKYALLIPSMPTLKFAILLAAGDELEQASRLALGGDAYLQQTAVRELIRLGYMKRQEVEVGSA
jgi:hypothetical protein